MRGVLDLRCTNLIADESFFVQTKLSSSILQKTIHKNLSLVSKQSKEPKVSFYLPRKDENGRGCAGITLMNVELIIDAGADGKHRFSGDFPLTILAYTENRHEVNVNIDKVIEQHGEKAGMGGINEVDMSNLVKLPSIVTVNDLLTQKRTPRFIEIELDYEGEVIAEPVIKPQLITQDNIKPLDRCTLEYPGSDLKTLILTGDSVIIGRNRKEADIVTWIMPLTEDNHKRTRMISSKHIALQFNPNTGPTIKLISKTNPATFEDKQLEYGEHQPVPLHKSSTLQLQQRFTLKITPLHSPSIPDEWLPAWLADADSSTHGRWNWIKRQQSQQPVNYNNINVGGFLIERPDDLQEQEKYLWLLTAANIVSTGSASYHHANTITVLSIPSLAVAVLADHQSDVRINGNNYQPGSAVLLNTNDLIQTTVNLNWKVIDWMQNLE